MKLARSFLVLSSLLLTGVSLWAQKPEDALLQADRGFNKATQEKRLDGWMTFMADDVVLLRAKAVAGKEAARKELEGDWADPSTSLSWEPTNAQMFASGSMGYTSGRWTYKAVDKGEKVELHGDYLTVWKKQRDGSWKVIWDGGSSDPASKK
jgi:ketosteroid isomerase-like protein